MSDYQILLLPKDNYYDWVDAAREYMLKHRIELYPSSIPACPVVHLCIQ